MRYTYIDSHIHPLIREYTLELNGFWRKQNFSKKKIILTN